MKYAALLKAIHSATAQLQGRAAMAVNQALILRNWLVGEWILEFEQHGKDRAKYGDNLLDKLAVDLKQSGLKGLDMRTLRDCRGLVRHYPQIRETVSPEFLARPDSGDGVPRIPATLSPKTAAMTPIRQAVSDELPTPLSPQALLRFSWSHLQELIAIDDLWKRAFFENECLFANWSVRQLRRQIGSLLYERTGLSANKKAVIQKARKQERQQDFTDLIRDPYVLEFTGLAERPEYLESDLESALLTHLQGFLLELGSGFCFEARQKRITEFPRPAAFEEHGANPDSGAQSAQILKLLEIGPFSANELTTRLGLESKTGAFKRSIKELMDSKFIEYTIPEKPNSRLQKYRLTSKGMDSIHPPT